LSIVEGSGLNRAIFQSVNRLTESRVRAKARRTKLDL
jgi:phage baseplate assembly protein W